MTVYANTERENQGSKRTFDQPGDRGRKRERERERERELSTEEQNQPTPSRHNSTLNNTASKSFGKEIKLLKDKFGAGID